MKKYLITSCLLLSFFFLAAQTATIRGHIYDKETGEPILFGYVLMENSTLGTTTDVDGFFTIPNLRPGDYNIVATYIGYDTAFSSITLRENQIKNINLFITQSGISLQEVNVSARKQQARTQTQVSAVSVSPRQIKSLPSTGGEADIAQYLTVLPGVISSGDQGGQIYIRGGSPVQTKVIMDGMTIYRPFHSIGFFSVFETEAIRNVDVLSGGFNADHGGRISAIVDIDTRQGDKTHLGGLVGVSPFQTRVLLEGPIKKFEEGGPGSISFMLSGKHSYLNETSKSLYDYAAPDSNGLPFTYTDLYGKLSFVSDNGSSFNFFGFNFVDDVNYAGVADIGWNSFGTGMEFNVVPPNSNLIFEGNISYSKYDISLTNVGDDPRENVLNDFNIKLLFSYFGYKNELRYGIDVNTFSTDFRFVNFLGIPFEQKVNNTDIAGFFKYKQILGNIILEPGLRVQYYAGQSKIQVEPRFSAKWNISDNLRFKLAGGMYSQNLTSTVSERDIVNFFVGFLSSPESELFKPGETTEKADHALQTAVHAVAGLEIDLNENLSVNVEPYFKDYTQLVSLNRSKLSAEDPDYITETGEAFGIDLSMSYQRRAWDIWATYSYGEVTRNDGFQEYPANFDRRHNINFLTSYSFGQKKSWQASVRWNMGSGFPFTQVIGYYGFYPFVNPGDLDYLTGNPDLTPIFKDEINGGRLPYYHRLDLSIKKRIEFSKHSNLEITGSVTNAYDRENIFYLDVLSLGRVNQLPILPSVGLKFEF
jgi:hypothetical protein